MYKDLEPYINKMQRKVNSKFEEYEDLFKSTEDFYDIDNALNNVQDLNFSANKFRLINDLRLASEGDKHSSGHEELIESLNFIVETYFYQDILSRFDDDYFFIQAGIKFIHRHLRENDSYDPDNNLKREVHLYYLSQLSISLSNSLSSVCLNHQDNDYSLNTLR